MRRAWLLLRNTFFWSYERGSWPYDLMVIAILVFVLLSPRSWFRDQPREVPGEHAVEIVLVAEDAEEGSTYRVDARQLEASAHAGEIERQLRDALQGGVEELHDRDFRIVRFELVLADDGAIAFYEVTIRQ
jgi:hypothetical protein